MAQPCGKIKAGITSNTLTLISRNAVPPDCPGEIVSIEYPTSKSSTTFWEKHLRPAKTRRQCIKPREPLKMVQQALWHCGFGCPFLEQPVSSTEWCTNRSFTVKSSLLRSTVLPMYKSQRLVIKTHLMFSHQTLLPQHPNGLVLEMAKNPSFVCMRYRHHQLGTGWGGVVLRKLEIWCPRL